MGKVQPTITRKLFYPLSLPMKKTPRNLTTDELKAKAAETLRRRPVNASTSVPPTMLNAIWDELQQVACNGHDIVNPFLTTQDSDALSKTIREEPHPPTNQQQEDLQQTCWNIECNSVEWKKLQVTNQRLQQERKEMLEAMRFLMDEIISLKEQLATLTKIQQDHTDLTELMKFLLHENNAGNEQLVTPLNKSIQRSKSLDENTIHLPKNSPPKEMEQTLPRNIISWQTTPADTRQHFVQVPHFVSDFKDRHANHWVDHMNPNDTTSHSIGHDPTTSKDNMGNSRSSSVNDLLDLLESSTCDTNHLLEEFDTTFRRRSSYCSSSSNSSTTVSSAVSNDNNSSSRNSLLEEFRSSNIYTS